MAWKFYNPNPFYNLTGDCVVRALSLALNKDWDSIYIGIALKGFNMGDMQNSNAVWGAYLKDNGFKRYIIPNECPDCYTVEDLMVMMADARTEDERERYRKAIDTLNRQ